FTCLGGVGGIAVCPAPVEVVTQGANQQISGTVKDAAGNTANASITLNIDVTSPSVAAAANPAPNAAGWNNTPVLVTFTCSDPVSGVIQCPSPINVSADGAQTISGTAADKAGNSATGLVVVSLDKTAPTINAITTPTPNAAGWNHSDVTVTYNCSD